MQLKISHTTTYSYDDPVQYALQQIRLTPKNRQGQQIINWHIEIEGGQIELEFDDQHNNRVTLASCERNCRELVVTAKGVVETQEVTGVIGRHGGHAPLWYFKFPTELTKPGKLIRQIVKTIEQDANDAIEKLHCLSALILDQVSYEVGNTQTTTSAEDAMANGTGVCQDHAHIFLSAARHMGFPARYVSGYLMLNDQIEQDATHAWVETHVEGLGWLGFDISNGISPDERYIPIATGLDYLEAAPISGIRFGDSEESMIVNLQVQQ